MDIPKLQKDLNSIKEILSRYLDIESPDHINKMAIRKHLQDVSNIITDYKKNVDEIVFRNHIESLRSENNEEELKKVYDNFNIKKD